MKNRMTGLYKMMIAVFAILFSVLSIDAQTNSDHVRVKGYYRKDGTYVRSHYRTKSNQTVNDNFSTLGNFNPYTGEPGWLPREPEYIYDSSLKGKIPKDYIYRSEERLKLEITNNLNKYTDFLSQNVEDSDIIKLYWTLDKGSISTYVDRGIWKFYAEEYYLDLLVLYFEGIKALLGRSGYLEFMYYSGIKRIEIKTDEYVLEYLVLELIEKLNLSK